MLRSNQHPPEPGDSSHSLACELIQTFFTGAYTASNKRLVKIVVWPHETALKPQVVFMVTILSMPELLLCEREPTNLNNRYVMKDDI